MRKIFNVSISIMLVLSLILCNVTVVLADEAVNTGIEVQKPSISADVEETQKPGESPDVEETQKPGESPDAEETQKPGESPDAEETQKPGESPDVEETQKPGESPDAEETQKPGESSGTEDGQQLNGIKKGEFYAVHYDLNAPISGTDFPNKERLIQAGSKVEIDFWPTISDYKFVGWETEDVEEGKVLYQSNGSFIMPENNVTLVGVWEIISEEEYTVTYILNPEYRDMYNLSNAGGKTLGDGITYSSQKDCKDKITGFGVVVTEKGQKRADRHVEMSMERDVTGKKDGSEVSYTAGTIVSVWDGTDAKVSYSPEIPFGFTSFEKGAEVRIVVTPASKKPVTESYTVKFLDENKEELTDLTATVEKGGSLTVPASLPNYYTAEENSKIQVFDKWAAENEEYTLEDLKNVTQDMTFMAAFKDVTAQWHIRYDGQIQAESGSQQYPDSDYTESVKETVIKDIKPINGNGSVDSSIVGEIQKQIVANTYDPSQVPVLTQEIFTHIASKNDTLKDANYQDYKIVWYVFKEGSNGYRVDGILVKNQEENKGEEPFVPSNPTNPTNPNSPSTPSAPSEPSAPPVQEEEVDIEEDEIPQAPADEEEMVIEDEEIPGAPAVDDENVKEPDSETEIPEDEIPQAPADTLPQTGTAAVINFYGLGLLMMAWGVFFLRKKRAQE